MEVPKLGEKMYVHVRNRDEAVKLLNYLHENDVMWSSGRTLVSHMYLDSLPSYDYYWFGRLDGLQRSSGPSGDGGVIEFKDLDIAKSYRVKVPVPKLGEDKFVRVESKEQATELLIYLHANGVRWCTGIPLVPNMYLHDFPECKLYWFGNPSGLTRANYPGNAPVIEFCDLDLWIEDEEPVQEDDMKILFEL